MSIFNPLITSHPLTCAQRLVTLDILREIYLVPHIPSADLESLISIFDSPWRASYENAPLETVSSVSASLKNLMFATRRLDPSEIEFGKFAHGSRLRLHLEALVKLVRRRMIWNSRANFGSEVIGSSGLSYAA